MDVGALARILEVPVIGGFDEVHTLLNEGIATVRRAIASFFDLKHRDDLLLFDFSGHGVRDEQGHLYLAVRDTERAVPTGTAIDASFVTAQMDRSASRRLDPAGNDLGPGPFRFEAELDIHLNAGVPTSLTLSVAGHHDRFEVPDEIVTLTPVDHAIAPVPEIVRFHGISPGSGNYYAVTMRADSPSLPPLLMVVPPRRIGSYWGSGEVSYGPYWTCVHP